MPSTTHRSLQFVGVALAVILLWLAFYPGTLATPYVTGEESPRYAHAIVPESSALSDENLDEYDLPVYQYDELSPIAQELFDRTRAAPDHRYTPDVCREFMLVCDTYAPADLPKEFTYGTGLHTEESLVYIETDGTRYLFETGWTGHVALFAFPFRLFIAWLTMLPLAGGVALVTATARNDRVLTGTVAGAALVASLAVLAPYVQMVGLVSAWTIRALLLAGVWASLLAAGGYLLYQRLVDARRGHSSANP